MRAACVLEWAREEIHTRDRVIDAGRRQLRVSQTQQAKSWLRFVKTSELTTSPLCLKALAWDAPDNPEHMDYVAEHPFAVRGRVRLPIPPIPVTVISADAGQSATNPDEQKIWLTGSSNPVHIVLSGGHDIYDDNPQGVIDQIHHVVGLVQEHQ